jgi:hypothetical protein
MTEQAKAEVKAPKKLPEGHVEVRVLKHGDGRISTGEHVPGKGDVCWAYGDVFACPKEVAADLEARLLVEIQ